MSGRACPCLDGEFALSGLVCMCLYGSLPVSGLGICLILEREFDCVWMGSLPVSGSLSVS